MNLQKIPLLLVTLCLALPLRGDGRRETPPALQALLNHVGLDKINAQIRDNGDENDCMIPPVFGVDPKIQRENCETWQREQIGLELAGQTFESMQEKLCAGDSASSLTVEECAPPLLKSFPSVDELYAATCEAYCQSLIPANAHGLINCQDGPKCQSLMGREDEIIGIGEGCFEGVKDGGETILAGLEAFATAPVDAYAGLVQITDGIIKLGFHDFIQRSLFEEERNIRATVEMARAFPEMMQNQLKALRCMESSVARQYFCHFGTVAGSIAAQAVLLRRVNLKEVEDLISARAFEMLDGGTGKAPEAPGFSLKGLSTTETVVDAFNRSPAGVSLKRDLTDIEFEILQRMLKDVPEYPDDSKFLTSLMSDMSPENYQAMVKLIKVNVRVSGNSFGNPTRALRQDLEPFLISANSRQIGTVGVEDSFQPPSSFNRIRDRAADVDSYEELPKANMSLLKDRRPIPTRVRSGSGYEKLEVAEINGETVFVKTSRASVGGDRRRNIRTEEDVVNESRMAVLLDRLEVGPKFYGASVEKNPLTGQENYVLVSEYVEGRAFSGNESNVGIPVTQSMIDDIRRAGQRLDAAGIEPSDIQFQLTPDGRAVLIDPEFFEFDNPGQTDAVQEMEAMAQRLEAIRLLQQRSGQ